MYDASLVEALTRDRRRFIKGLRYNLPPARPFASAVLSAALSSPVALYIVPPGADPDYRYALDTLVAESALPAWIWAADQGPIPGFPRREAIRDARR